MFLIRITIHSIKSRDMTKLIKERLRHYVLGR